MKKILFVLIGLVTLATSCEKLESVSNKALLCDKEWTDTGSRTNDTYSSTSSESIWFYSNGSYKEISNTKISFTNKSLGTSTSEYVYTGSYTIEGDVIYVNKTHISFTTSGTGSFEQDVNFNYKYTIEKLTATTFSYECGGAISTYYAY